MLLSQQVALCLARLLVILVQITCLKKTLASHIAPPLLWPRLLVSPFDIARFWPSSLVQEPKDQQIRIEARLLALSGPIPDGVSHHKTQ